MTKSTTNICCISYVLHTKYVWILSEILLSYVTFATRAIPTLRRSCSSGNLRPTMRSWCSDFKIEEDEMSRMSSNNTRANEKGKDEQMRNTLALASRLRRKRRMRSIQEGATARSRSEVLMPRTSKSDGIQFDEPWSLKCACRSAPREKERLGVRETPTKYRGRYLSNKRDVLDVTELLLYCQ